MGYVQVNKLVAASPATVWRCLNDIDHTPEWVVGLEGAEIKTSGAYGVGAVYHDYNRLGPFPQVTAWRITVFEPMTCQIHESDSNVLPSVMILKLAPEGTGTRVQMEVIYRFLPRLGMVSRLLEATLMNRLLRGVLGQNLANLDEYLGRASVRLNSGDTVAPHPQSL